MRCFDERIWLCMKRKLSVKRINSNRVVWVRRELKVDILLEFTRVTLNVFQVRKDDRIKHEISV